MHGGAENANTEALKHGAQKNGAYVLKLLLPLLF